MTQKIMSFDDSAIVTFNINDYPINFCFMTKNEAVNKMKNKNLNEKSGQLWLQKDHLL